MALTFSATVRREREPTFRWTVFVALASVAAVAIGMKRDLPWLLFVAMAPVLVRSWRDRARTQKIVASDAGLQLDGEWLAIDAITNARALDESLRVETLDGAYDVAVSADRARALRLAKRVKRIRVHESMPFASATSVAIVLALVVVLYAGALLLREHFGMFVTAFIGLALVAAIAQVHFTRVLVGVGIDGLSISSRRRTRFLAWSEVRDVRVEHARVNASGRSRRRGELAPLTHRRTRATQAPRGVRRVRRPRP